MMAWRRAVSGNQPRMVGNKMRVNGTSPLVWKAHVNRAIEGFFWVPRFYCIFLLFKQTYKTVHVCMLSQEFIMSDIP